MKYLIIIPVYNEEGNIGGLLESLVAQTVQPVECIVVEDGSTDGTADVVKEFAAAAPWIRLVEHMKNSTYESGPKIARACVFGYNCRITEAPDLIVKLDADLVLPAAYFERVISAFETDAELGLCGGVCVTQQSSGMKVERVADDDHVRGALKTYRNAAYNQIGGIRPVEGWDTLDELLLLLYGWKIKVLANLEVVHKRKTDTNTGKLKAAIKLGRGCYMIGYNFWITVVSAAKMTIRKPYIITFFYAMYGYFSELFSGKKREVTREQRKFINSYRWKRMKNKLNMTKNYENH